MNPLLGDRRATLILIGPALLIYSVVMLVPIVASFGYTFTTGNAITGFTFSGFDNYVRLVSDARVRDALLVTIRYAVLMTVLQVGFGYLLSLLYVFVLRRWSSAVRTLVFFPVVLPTVAVALLFQQMFAIAPQNGLVNTALEAVGLSSVDWFGDGGTAFLVIIVMDVWRSMGFYGVLLYAGLLDIPEEVFESARIDGASGFGLVRRIVLPLSLPVLVSSLIFSANGTLKVFDSILALTNGGPGTSTSPLTIYMFDTSFRFGQYGYGSTVAFLLTIVSLLVTVFIFRANRRDLTKD
ncbi:MULTISPECIES: carbohydrate ABC transporter permease [unclassified Frigoribacterium]|uniref:carbohydrate ABC transporter permease n=1 Tax=unclassified Frigoribacterium TaxID=2627005 RepID=UPI0005B97259|nr:MULTISPECIES: sugar ABC transporter permease [unclassified Frigoribacterium]KIU03301.1 ABC transporter permease [Frigoribacterium sp. MEB024]KQO47668.1 ABC transporter permease [Frigoribacterium sp. Leaf254]KQT39761.1 ABC transporter permease [Frigoribacterium sp. Leaf415]MBD8538242.1 sugar ABC transporter permease [Frigoribacterium sp. CFBP 8751]ROS51120.1 multiple sugar transport system permease protein/raffinose/stachyose/melibiose transport system permease protein [Frigoribacterium sp. 